VRNACLPVVVHFFVLASDTKTVFAAQLNLYDPPWVQRTNSTCLVCPVIGQVAHSTGVRPPSVPVLVGHPYAMT
jgi:hypothetical protein